MEKATSLSGLYVITPAAGLTDKQLQDHVEWALMGGARIVQYRDKTLDFARRLRQAQQLLDLCQQHGATFIINDDVELALAVRAHGVHLGGEDTPLSSARQCLGSEAIIGASCYNRLELAIRAQQQGADYVAFGRFFPSRTKPQAVPADIALLRQAKAQLHLPIVAIGGITAQNGAQLIAAGADMLAVVDAVFAQQDIVAAARQLADCFLQADCPNG
ncbi:MAG: thiamine phosphate synthase [Gammaproteobacteria bacterium]|jgi:thiamine-phosphate pyrophosphorylase|nr:thiamine phosphate synthase [Gammaproteobacteria bacterium]